MLQMIGRVGLLHPGAHQCLKAWVPFCGTGQPACPPAEVRDYLAHRAGQWGLEPCVDDSASAGLSSLLAHDHLLELCRDLPAAELTALITTSSDLPSIVTELSEFAVGLVAQNEQLQAALRGLHGRVEVLQRNYWRMCRLLRLAELNAQHSPEGPHTPHSWSVASEVQAEAVSSF